MKVVKTWYLFLDMMMENNKKPLMSYNVNNPQSFSIGLQKGSHNSSQRS